MCPYDPSHQPHPQQQCVYWQSCRQGLGTGSSGRVEPVEIVILPPGLGNAHTLLIVLTLSLPPPHNPNPLPPYPPRRLNIPLSLLGLSLDACVELRERGQLKKVDDSCAKASRGGAKMRGRRGRGSELESAGQEQVGRSRRVVVMCQPVPDGVGCLMACAMVLCLSCHPIDCRMCLHS